MTLNITALRFFSEVRYVRIRHPSLSLVGEITAFLYEYFWYCFIIIIVSYCPSRLHLAAVLLLHQRLRERLQLLVLPDLVLLLVAV